MPASAFESKIIPYQRLIAECTATLVGRRWVVDVVRHFLAAAAPRYLLLLGEPGCGKTTTMAYLVQQFGFPHHFIGSGSLSQDGDPLSWRDPVRFAESLGYQLVRDYGGWIMDWSGWGIQVSQRVGELSGRLVGVQVDDLDATPRPQLDLAIDVRQQVRTLDETAQVIGVYIDTLRVEPEAAVRQLLVEPLRRIAGRWPKHQVVLLVDGLDEAATVANPAHSIVRLWPHGMLPSNVRFVLSAQRPEQVPAAILDAAETVWLSESVASGRPHPGVARDAAAFVAQLFAQEGVARLLATQQLDPAATAQQVVDASGGNFLFLFHLARDLRQEHADLLQPGATPLGLEGIYDHFWRRITAMAGGNMAWLDGVLKPVLGMLACAGAPLTRAQLVRLADVRGSSLDTVLQADALIPFLDVMGQGSDRRYAYFHPAFAAFLTHPDAGRIDALAVHRRLAERFFADYVQAGWTEPEPIDSIRAYALAHIVKHTLHAGYEQPRLRQRLVQILSPEFVARRSELAGWHMPAVRDLQQVAARDPEAIVTPGIRILRGARRNSLVNQHLVRLLRQIRPALAAQLRRENRLPATGVVLRRPGSSTDHVIDAAIAALAQPGDAAAATISRLDQPDLNHQVRGVLALALGETGSPAAVDSLVAMLVTAKQRGENHVSWCAADGLVALRLSEPETGALVQRLLQALEDVGITDGARQRLLYVIGRRRTQLPLEVAMGLVHLGLGLRSRQGRGRSLDLIYLLRPGDEALRRVWEAEFVPVLRTWLGLDGRGGHVRRPASRDEWVLKRAVTALGRVGTPAERDPLHRLLAQVRTDRRRWPAPRGQEQRRRRQGLLDALERALDDLTRRHL